MEDSQRQIQEGEEEDEDKEWAGPNQSERVAYDATLKIFRGNHGA